MIYLEIKKYIWNIIPLFRKNTRGPADHYQGRQGEHEQAHRRDSRRLHHSDGQAQAGDAVYGRSTRRAQGNYRRSTRRAQGNYGRSTRRAQGNY